MKNIIDETARLITESEILCEMANLSFKSTGLSVDIWSDMGGVDRNKVDKVPRVKVRGADFEASVSIEPSPRILAKTKNLKSSQEKQIDEAIKYIARNYDLLLKHYNAGWGGYNDDDLKRDLKERGDYK